MQYLSDINESIQAFDQEFEYIDALGRPDLFFGLACSVGDRVNFSKLSLVTKNELINNYDLSTRKECITLECSASGCRLRFYTESDIIVFKIELNREWDYKKMNLWSSSGFDVYSIEKGKYKHSTVFAPESGKRIFAETIRGKRNLCIFLPSYNEIKKMYIGIRKECNLCSIPYESRLPILFYGNSITQGAAASRSGNSFCNMVSRMLDCDIINFSISSCCRGLISSAETLGKINCRAIIIDYTRNAYTISELKCNHFKFYMEVRKYHPDIPIILMTSSNFSNWVGYYEYDNVVRETYEKAKQNGENTFLINQRSLFSEEDWDLITVDGVHYTDLGMKAVADAICSVLRKEKVY